MFRSYSCFRLYDKIRILLYEYNPIPTSSFNLLYPSRNHTPEAIISTPSESPPSVACYILMDYFQVCVLYLSPPGCSSGYSRSGEGDRLKLRSYVSLYVWMRISLPRKALRLMIISIDNPYVFCLSSIAYHLLLAELPSLSLWHW